MNLTPADYWILHLSQTISSKYGKATEQVQCEINGNYVYIRVEPTAIGKKIASEALYTAEKLLAEKYSLRVIVGDRILDDLSPSNDEMHDLMIVQDIIAVSQSEWLSRCSGRSLPNLRMVEMITSQVGSVYILDANTDRGNPIKAVIPFLGLTQTLSLPPNQLIGKPSNYAAPGSELVGTVRARTVREGIATGEYSESYDFKWSDRWWPMEVEFIPLDHEGEVMVVSRNKADHQRQYWRDIKDGLSR